MEFAANYTGYINLGCSSLAKPGTFLSDISVEDEDICTSGTGGLLRSTLHLTVGLAM